MNKFNITKNELYKLYISNDMSIADIARYYKCSDKNISNHLNANGIVRKKKHRLNLKTNLANTKIGKLSITSIDHVENEYENYWNCICDCGSGIIVSAQNLLCTDGRRIRSCGCGRLKKWKIIPPYYWQSIITKAKRRAIRFNLTVDFAEKIFLDQNSVCALSGVPLNFSRRTDARKNNGTASLDRIDSSLPYEEGNVQWVHKRINIMKHTSSDEEFINWCKLVAKASV